MLRNLVSISFLTNLTITSRSGSRHLISFVDLNVFNVITLINKDIIFV